MGYQGKQLQGSKKKGLRVWERAGDLWLTEGSGAGRAKIRGRDVIGYETRECRGSGTTCKSGTHCLWKMGGVDVDPRMMFSPR